MNTEKVGMERRAQGVFIYTYIRIFATFKGEIKSPEGIFKNTFFFI